MVSRELVDKLALSLALAAELVQLLEHRRRGHIDLRFGLLLLLLELLIVSIKLPMIQSIFLSLRPSMSLAVTKLKLEKSIRPSFVKSLVLIKITTMFSYRFQVLVRCSLPVY